MLIKYRNTHDKLKPHFMFVYASADYPQIDKDAVYDITVTTCEGGHTKTSTEFSFSQGSVFRINQW